MKYGLATIALCSTVFLQSCGSDSNTDVAAPVTGAASEMTEVEASAPAEVEAPVPVEVEAAMTFTGNSRISRIDTTSVSRHSSFETFHFDDAGRLLGGELRSSGAVDGTWTNVYDDENRLIKYVFTHGYPSGADSTEDYIYEGERLAGYFISVPGETPHTVFQYVYIDGLRSGYERRSLDPELLAPTLDDGTLQSIATYSYDELGLISGVVVNRVNGVLRGSDTFTHNSVGQRISSKNYDQNGWWIATDSFAYEDEPCMINQWYCVKIP